MTPEGVQRVGKKYFSDGTCTVIVSPQAEAPTAAPGGEKKKLGTNAVFL